MARRRRVLWTCLATCSLNLILLAQPVTPERLISARFRQLTRDSQWRLVSSLAFNFDTRHPQGLVKIGDTFFVSAVEVREPTQRFAWPQNGLDRDAGSGAGHLFKVDRQGQLVADLPMGEGTIYHPGGIDFDGQFIWVPVAEYRPNSRLIIYRVDPAASKATEVFRYPDHIGGLVHDVAGHSLHGVSWGSRYFYRWTLDGQGHVTNASTPPARLREINPEFYIDYQDCKSVGRNEMLCAGLSSYQSPKSGGRFSLGGLELIDLTVHRPVHQIPFEHWTDSGLPMTQNPFWIEPTEHGLRAYFLPEDQRSTLYIFETGS